MKLGPESGLRADLDAGTRGPSIAASDFAHPVVNYFVL